MDEDCVDIVEAIDTWIDEVIDDLDDDELEEILELRDVVSDSTFADFEIEQIYDEDIDELVELAGGSDDDRALSYRVLQAAVYGDPFFVGADPSNDAHATTDHADDDADAATAEADEIDADAATDTNDVGDVTTDHAEEPVGEPEPDEAELPEVALGQADESELPEVALGQADESELPEVALGQADESDLTGEDHSNFLNDLAALHASTDSATSAGDKPDEASAVLSPVAPIVLRAGDALGPSFLDPSEAEPKRQIGALRQYVLGAFMLVGLAAFGFGMLQLLNSLEEEEPQVATAAEAGGAETDNGDDASAQPAATAAAAATATPEPTLVPGAPTPTPTPEPTPPPRLGVRLTSGDVMLATFPATDEPPTFDLVYDASDDDFEAAVQVAWLNDLLGVVDTEGDIFVIDPNARRPRPEVIYEAGGGLGEAVELASSLTRVAVRTSDGDIALIPSDERADPDIVEFVWDASEEGQTATDVTSVGDLVPFVLENGNALMIVGSDENRLASIWSAADQPPAVNTSASRAGILLGVGQGAVARYELGERQPGAPRLVTVWDPFATSETPAIGYSNADSRTAVVLADGAIVMADETGTGEKIWDPTETELRALSVSGSETQLVVLLETGSIVVVPLAQNGVIESIWDITDETLSAAAQVVLEQLAE